MAIDKEKTEQQKFDVVVKQMLSVSHEELQRRDKEWRRRRAQNKKLKEQAPNGN